MWIKGVYDSVNWAQAEAGIDVYYQERLNELQNILPE